MLVSPHGFQFVSQNALPSVTASSQMLMQDALCWDTSQYQMTYTCGLWLAEAMHCMWDKTLEHVVPTTPVVRSSHPEWVAQGMIYDPQQCVTFNVVPGRF